MTKEHLVFPWVLDFDNLFLILSLRLTEIIAIKRYGRGKKTETAITSLTKHSLGAQINLSCSLHNPSHKTMGLHYSHMKSLQN